MKRMNITSLFRWGCLAALLFNFYLSALLSFKEGLGEKEYLLRRANIQLFEKIYQEKNFEVSQQSEEEVIPKIIHQIWIGGPLPEKFVALTETWKKMHPEWEYKLWTDDDLESFPFINKRAFDAATNFGMKADILRYEVLRAYGGLYVDIDFECIKPMDAFHHSHNFYCGLDPQGIIGNSMIGATPFHPIIESCIVSISKLKRFALSDDEIQMVTGPFLLHFTAAYLMKKKIGNAICYPTKFFFPFEYTDCIGKTVDEVKNTNQNLLTPDTFAIHYWAESWCKDTIED